MRIHFLDVLVETCLVRYVPAGKLQYTFPAERMFERLFADGALAPNERPVPSAPRAIHVEYPSHTGGAVRLCVRREGQRAISGGVGERERRRRVLISQVGVARKVPKAKMPFAGRRISSAEREGGGCGYARLYWGAAFAATSSTEQTEAMSPLRRRRIVLEVGVF